MVFSVKFSFQACRFWSSNDPRFACRSSQEKARKSCGWQRLQGKTESSREENVVHFNSRFLNLLLLLSTLHSRPSFYVLFGAFALRGKFTKWVAASPSAFTCLYFSPYNGPFLPLLHFYSYPRLSSRFLQLLS